MSDPKCNICGTPKSSFKNYNGVPRQCSKCGSVERQRVLQLLLGGRGFGRVPFYGKRILVVAPSVAERKILANNGAPNITSVDIRPEIKPDILADISAMPQIPDASYDAIVASFVFCMTKDYRGAISEFERVMAPDGFMLSSDPVRQGPTFEYHGDRVSAWYGTDNLNRFGVGHFREFGAEDLAGELQKQFKVNVQRGTDPITGTSVSWFISRKINKGRPRVATPTAMPNSTASKMHVIQLHEYNSFISVETSVPATPPDIQNFRFGDHADGELLCYGNGVAVVSRDLGNTWEIHETPECKDANIIVAFIGRDGYLLQSIGKESGVDEPPTGWATIFAYDKNWRFLGTSRPSLAHWHASWSIGQNGSTIMWGTYYVNSDKYKSDYWSDQEKYRDRVFPNIIYRSRDAGVTWEPVLELGPDKARHFHCVQPDPFRPGTWWASTGDVPKECRLYRSDDDGDSWTDVTGAATTSGHPSFRSSHQAAYRFTALAFTPDAMLWPTDDWMGGLQHYDQRLPLDQRAGSRLFLSARDPSKVDTKEVAYLGYAARSITDAGPGWIVTTESKYPEISVRPQVFYVPKADLSQTRHLFDIDNYHWRGTGFTYARASRIAQDGVFFSFRQAYDGFRGGAKLMRWKVHVE